MIEETIICDGCILHELDTMKALYFKSFLGKEDVSKIMNEYLGDNKNVTYIVFLNPDNYIGICKNGSNRVDEHIIKYGESDYVLISCKIHENIEANIAYCYLLKDYIESLLIRKAKQNGHKIKNIQNTESIPDNIARAFLNELKSGLYTKFISDLEFILEKYKCNYLKLNPNIDAKKNLQYLF